MDRRDKSKYGGTAMKRLLIACAAIMLLIAGNTAVQAQEGPGVDLGLKMWLNSWHQDSPGSGGITSDTTMLVGPALEVRFPNHLFLEASLLGSTSDYSFPEPGGSVNIDRQDFDIALGYMVVPGFGILGGYKDSTFKESATGLQSTVSGPVIGVIGIAPVDEQLSFYGRLEYLFTEFTTNDPFSANEDSPGWIFDVGVKYAFTRGFSGSIGYRYETNEGDVSHVRDSFSGVTLAGMFTF
jgi:opacity protein-like surface antigen